MLSMKLLTVVKAIRFRYAILFVVLLIAAYLGIINPWMKNWGSTAAEQQMVLPGDELYSDRLGQTTQAITIHASPDVVWQWLVQIGQDRAGFYTYTWLENLFGADIHNANEIRPEWQHLVVGDVWRLVPPDYLGGLGKEMGSPVLISDPGHALVLEMWGAYVLMPGDEHTTRLIVRGQPGTFNLFTKMFWEPTVFTLARRMLLGLKARAEGLPDAPAALMTVAIFGWVSAGISIVVVFISHRQRWYWLSLPVLAALPALLTSSDVQAALAAFIATGVTVLGFLIYGRSWWGPYFVIGSVVMLTLLLVPEAYSALGVAFALILLVALGVRVAGQQKSVDRETPKLASTIS